MKAWLLFALAAVRARNAYIDFDGTIAYSIKVDSAVPFATNQEWLEAWQLEVIVSRGRLVYRRLIFLLALRLLGVQLHLWTNRGPFVRDATFRTLGRWAALFTTFEFHGKAHISMPDKTASTAQHLGPLMDDVQKYVDLGKPGSLLVRAK